jgi:hypothetical protein
VQLYNRGHCLLELKRTGSEPPQENNAAITR